MQYSQNRKNKNSGFFVIILLCVIAIAVTSAVIIRSEKNNNSSDNNSSSDKASSYNNSKDDVKDDMDSAKRKIESDISSTASDIGSKAEDIKDDVKSKAKNAKDDVSSSISHAKEKISETTGNEKKGVPYEKKSFILPITGNIIKGFSDVTLQYDKTFGDMRMHNGIDIACEKNAQVSAVTSGTVTDIEDTANYSGVITVDHGDGLTVKYCGMGSIDVKKGQKLTGGTILGTAEIPPCECMDEYHIHIECLKDGNPVSPTSAFGF